MPTAKATARHIHHIIKMTGFDATLSSVMYVNVGAIKRHANRQMRYADDLVPDALKKLGVNACAFGGAGPFDVIVRPVFSEDPPEQSEDFTRLRSMLKPNGALIHLYCMRSVPSWQWVWNLIPLSWLGTYFVRVPHAAS